MLREKLDDMAVDFDDKSEVDCERQIMQDIASDPKYNIENPSNKDLLGVLKEIKIDTAKHDKKLSVVEHRVQALFDHMKDMQVEMEKQEKQISMMERAALHQSARLIHLSNDLLHERNVSRLFNLIFTGVKVTNVSTPADTQKELDAIMQILGVTNWIAKEKIIFPWGTGFAMKCTFAQAGTCSEILRSSFKLHSAANKSKGYAVRQDL